DRAGLFVFHLGEGTSGGAAAVEPTAQATIPPADTRTAPTSVPQSAATSVPTTFAPAPAPTMRPSGERGVEVAYALDGDLNIWNEGSNQSRTIFSEGGVDLVVASDDGQHIAF